jgi:hypothetical protein
MVDGAQGVPGTWYAQIKGLPSRLHEWRGMDDVQQILDSCFFKDVTAWK